MRRLLTGLDAADSRRLLLPALINFCIVVLVSDFDNNLVFLMRSGALPFAVVALCSARRMTIRSLPGASEEEAR